MPEKTWLIHLDPDARILVFLHTRGPIVLGFAVVLVVHIDGDEICATRYDTAHGQAHRDVIGRKAGLIEKQWLLDLTRNEAFEYALNDLRENYGAYIRYFLEN